MLHPLIRPLILVSNFKIYDSLLYLQCSPKNVRYPLVSNIFMHFFSSIIDIKIGCIKLAGVAGVGWGVGLFEILFK